MEFDEVLFVAVFYAAFDEATMEAFFPLNLYGLASEQGVGERLSFVRKAEFAQRERVLAEGTRAPKLAVQIAHYETGLGSGHERSEGVLMRKVEGAG